MRDLDGDICSSLERLTDPAAGTRDADVLWRDLVARRRRRRARNGAAAAVPVVLIGALGAGVFAAQDPDSGRSDVAAGDNDSEAPEEAATGASAVGDGAHEELQEHLQSLGADVPEGVLPEVVVPVRPPDGWTLEAAGASFPSGSSRGSIGFDYVDVSSTRQPLPAVHVGTTTLPAPEACTTTDETLERRLITTGSGSVACLVGDPASVAEWADVEWTTIPRSVHG